MSRVFVAEEMSLGRKVVVKVLPHELAASVNIERFRREIQLAAKLQHPLIVPVLSAGVSDGLPYYTMPLVQGESLRARVSKSGELPIPEVVRILRDILSALSYAHEEGVVHRDMKPDNVLLTKHHAMVTDFGVAKALSAATNPGSSLTSLGVALGTPAYMAPEQAAADPNADHRADLYAVGATAYEMLTGRQLFSGRSPQAMLAAQAIETPEPVEKLRPSVPPILAALVMRSLEKHAADRPQSADEMLNVVQGLATPSGGLTPTMSVPLQAPRVKKSRLPMIVGGAVLTALAAGAFFFIQNRRESAAPLDDARVLVAPFQNKTGDARFDAVGGMATDWVTRGLSETGVVDVAPYVPKRDAQGNVLPEAYDVASVVRDARAATAGKVVMGAFYKQGDSLLFQANILDAADGKSLGAVSPSSSPSSAPMVAIAAMRARIANALGEMTRSDLGGFSTQDAPPSFEAYKEFLQGEDAFNTTNFYGAVGHYMRAAKLDTNYVAPLVRAAYAYSNLRQDRVVDSIGKVLEPKRGTMSPYEAHYLDRVLAWNRGDWYAAYTSAKKLLATAPKSSFALYVAARSATPINRPAEALAGLEKLDIRRKHTGTYFADLASALHMLGEHERELEVAKLYRAENAGLVTPLPVMARALAALGKTKELHEVVDAALSMPSAGGVGSASIYSAAVSELNAHGFVADAKEFAGEWLTYLQTQPAVADTTGGAPSGPRLTPVSDPRIALLMTLGRDREAKVIADSVAAKDPGSVSSLTFGGILAARLGDRAGAEKNIAQLGAINDKYGRGVNIFGQAQIAALLGDKPRAVQLLRISISRGVAFPSLHAVPAFVKLKGFAPFDELIKPKG